MKKISNFYYYHSTVTFFTRLRHRLICLIHVNCIKIFVILIKISICWLCYVNRLIQEHDFCCLFCFFYKKLKLEFSKNNPVLMIVSFKQKRIHTLMHFQTMAAKMAYVTVMTRQFRLLYFRLNKNFESWFYNYILPFEYFYTSLASVQYKGSCRVINHRNYLLVLIHLRHRVTRYAAPVVERSVRAPHWPHVRQAKFCLRVCQVVFLGFHPPTDWSVPYELTQS